MTRYSLVLLLLPMLLLGCTEASPPDDEAPEPRQGALQTTSSTSQPGTRNEPAPLPDPPGIPEQPGPKENPGPKEHPDYDPVLEAELKGGIPTVVHETDLNQALATLDTIDLLDLDANSRANLEDLPLPVLLPDVSLAEMVTARGEHWYTATVQLDGHSIYIMGNHKAVQHPSIPAQELAGLATPAEGPLAEEGYRMTRTHAIVSLAFRAYGAAYHLDVECNRPMTNPRCTDDAYIISVAERLNVLDEGAR